MRPLKELLAQADALIGASAPASSLEKSAASSEAESLAVLLSGATESVTLGQGQSDSVAATEIEKAAMAMSRVHTAVCIDAMTKVSQFEEKARKAGYDESQIQEALSKTAAKKMVDNLPLLVAVTEAPAGTSPDRNVLPVKPTKKSSLDRGRLMLTRNLGY